MEVETAAINEAIQSTVEIVPSSSPDCKGGGENVVEAEIEAAVPRTTNEKRKRDEGHEDQDGNENPDKIFQSGPALHPLWKTSLCSYYRSQKTGGGACSHGESCRFAHGEEELRPRLDGTWDPTSARATNNTRRKNKMKNKVRKTRNGSDEEERDEDEEEEDPMEEEGADPTNLDKCLIGLPKNWGTDNLKKFLDDKGILYKSAKKKKKMTVGFVVLENAEQIKDAIEVLNDKSGGGKQIKVADATRRSHEKIHASIDNKNDYIDNEGLITEGLVPKMKSARDVVTPLAHMPYIEQLEHKKKSLLKMLKRLTWNARKACPDDASIPDWILKSREIGRLPCKFEGILESPVVAGYRNKCEFSVGHSLQGKRTVGFMLGNFREGVTAVEEPVNCPNVSRISCKYALIFQDFLQSSIFPVWNRISNAGFWRQLTVREGRSSAQASVHDGVETPIAEVMLLIQVCSVDVDEERMKNEFRRLAQVLVEGAAACSPPLPLTTIVVQDHKGISNVAPADCPLLPLPLPDLEGHSSIEKSSVTEARIHDYISNLCFSISPTAFFQVNTLAAERLYTLAGDWAELSPETLLFDICCGTGTIGLTLAHRVGMVVGIEMNESAVSDAQRNAQINNIKNCKFVCGKAEDVIGAVLKEYLNMPQQCDDASDALGSNCIDKDSNESRNESLDVSENLDGDITVDLKNENDNGEALEVFGNLDGECTGSNKEKRSNDSFADGSSHCKTYGTSSLKSHENKECRDENQDFLKEADENKENAECRNTHVGCSSEEKEIKTAPVCHFEDIVAIVDPPRVGLHPIVIRALRTNPRIRRLVYISCNPESLVANAIELCTPTSGKSEKAKGNRGWRNMSSAGLARQRTKSMPTSEPFRPVKSVAVDLFPHTMHCEMVMLLER